MATATTSVGTWASDGAHWRGLTDHGGITPPDLCPPSEEHGERRWRYASDPDSPRILVRELPPLPHQPAHHMRAEVRVGHPADRRSPRQRPEAR